MYVCISKKLTTMLFIQLNVQLSTKKAKGSCGIDKNLIKMGTTVDLPSSTKKDLLQKQLPQE